VICSVVSHTSPAQIINLCTECKGKDERIVTQFEKCTVMQCLLTLFCLQQVLPQRCKSAPTVTYPVFHLKREFGKGHAVLGDQK